MQQDTDRSGELQRRIFGERYVGASLSKLRGIPDEAIERIAKWTRTPTGFLVLIGPAGTGKTYFCAAILENLPKGVRFVRAYQENDLLRKVRDSISDGSKGDYITCLKYLLDDDLIIIDDFGSSGHTDWREEVLFVTVDYRYSRAKPTIITSNFDGKQICEVYGKRIASRLLSKENTIINLFGNPDLRQEGF